MAVRFGKRLPNWVMLAAGTVLVGIGLVLAAVNRPVPEYLVAVGALKPGAPIQSTQVKVVAMDLAEAGSKYLLAEDLALGAGVSRVVRDGEILARADLTFELDPNLTSLRLTPKLKPSKQVQAGSSVSVWEVVEAAEGRQVKQLVPSAEVLELIYGDGLFDAEFPEVELRLSWEQSVLLLEAISSESDLYILPLT